MPTVRRPVKVDPGNAEWQRDLSVSYNNPKCFAKLYVEAPFC
jgi:hypothetical protein